MEPGFLLCIKTNNYYSKQYKQGNTDALIQVGENIILFMTKKIFFILALMGGIVSGIQAQSVFSKGDKVLHLGVGVGSYLGGTNYTSTIPPLQVSYEQGIVGNLIDGNASIGVGGYAAYSANKWKYDSDNGYKYSYVIVGVRGAFHYQFIDKLDTYAGAMIGYNIVSGTWFGSGTETVSGASASSVAYSTFLGARYYFTDKVAIFAEVGYGIAALELGVAFKL